MMEQLTEFGVCLFGARSHQTEPILPSVIKSLDVGIVDVDLFTMFDDDDSDLFHLAIDEIDVHFTKGHLIDTRLVKVLLSKIVSQKQYLLSWCMFEGHFKNPNDLFRTEWTIVSTYGLCLKDQKPVVEFLDKNRRSKEWLKIMEQGTSVIQSQLK